MGKILRGTKEHALFVFNVSKQVGLPWRLADYETDIEQEHAIYFVSSAGFIGAHMIYDSAEIINLAVLKECQKKGYAKQLWHALMCELEKRQIKTCFLEVRASNEVAKRFYEAIGFVKISQRKQYYRNPVEDAWIYRWEDL